MTRRSSDREAWLFALGAIALRLAWVRFVPTHPVGDFAMYLESADYLVEHGALDPEFIYMPGYVLLLAGVRALGGGLLACKLVGVAAGGLATAACYGIAYALFNRASARAAGLLAALWPAGIAVSSVTGTDMPAAALLAAAVWALVRSQGKRPLRAAVGFGLLLGLAATIRAVALPLAFLAGFYWLALRVPARQVLLRTALGAGVAFLVLVPWGVRNRLRYGEVFFTDSHGGHTALIGANPNSEGVYSRSLNQLFWKGTGYRLFEEPHREADRQAYTLAWRWTTLEPRYAVGLLAAKADRLLAHERPLLYWPLYRQGVLRGPAADWFGRHRAELEALADYFWYALVAAALAGALVAASRRVWDAVAILSIPAALTALYVIFFAEVRYHLAIAVFLFPFAGLAVAWAPRGLRLLARGRGKERWYFLRELAIGGLVVGGLTWGWPRLMAAGADVRARHRFAVSVCELAGHGHVCAWRATAPAPGQGPSPVRGVWDGIGITVGAGPARAATDVELPRGRYRVSALADAVGGSATGPSAKVALAARGAPLASATLVPGAPPTLLAGVVDHPGGTLRLEVGAERASADATVASAGATVAGAGATVAGAAVAGAAVAGAAVAGAAVWIADIKIVSDGH